jgi:hypothetical protein
VLSELAQYCPAELHCTQLYEMLLQKLPVEQVTHEEARGPENVPAAHNLHDLKLFASYARKLVVSAYFPGLQSVH